MKDRFYSILAVLFMLIAACIEDKIIIFSLCISAVLSALIARKERMKAHRK